MRRKNKVFGLGLGVATVLSSGLMLGLSGSPMAAKAVGFALSPPAGVQMIFVSNRGGIISGTPNGNDIYTMNANGSGVVRLTANVWAEYEPQWNPFGTKIAFTSNQTGNWDVYTMNPDGTGVVNLTNNAAFDFGSTWSPDGTKIAFASDRDNRGVVKDGDVPGDGSAQIYVMNADGTNVVRLTNIGHNGHPAWSPDGSKIAFFSNRDGNEEVYVMNANGTGQTRLTNHASVDYSPNWSPDGSKIAFTSSRTGNTDIYTMNSANGSGLKRITTSNLQDNEPAYSPDGSQIIFYRLHDIMNREIYIMGSDGKRQTRLTNNNPFLDADPTWKP